LGDKDQSKKLPTSQNVDPSIFFVIPAQAGIQSYLQLQNFWIPASAGMTDYPT
jgi:hypothetical protein